MENIGTQIKKNTKTKVIKVGQLIRWGGEVL